ncbi:MAG TPA: DUF4956 domain-containing protein [Anaerolineae bacterium]|nr:DUF4956 domain-containing protein [Anaerolineae bacterium]
MIEQWLETLLSAQGASLMGELLLSLLVAAVLSFVLSWHYVRFGKTYSNRRELAQVFPIIILATVLIISIVKSSIALSLGLVGALSIVRFRTPIKEPEELAYLFVAIAIGIGIGAGQVAVSLMAAIVIMLVLMLRSAGKGGQRSLGLLVNVEVPRGISNDSLFREINGFVAKEAPNSNLRRLDMRDGIVQATYFVDCGERDQVIDLMEGLSGMLPGAAISFVEQGGIPGR